ncbi:peptidase M23 [Sagittula salina]|uniref:Peptidase M23 n=1 Tax=Sagittula salina TaxID=2820268 RepID=A0A940MK08_9RHOB|nr:peptidase M23 [Sagittula salina]MBP0483220.1 peptidase M23 [Sagittula salina]
MKYLVAIAALAAGPAIAHEAGAHLHPHGSEPAMMLALLALLAAGAVAWIGRR